MSTTVLNLQSQSFHRISGQPPPPPPVPANGGFPMLAVAVLGITATAFILVAYYIFVTNCCFRWQLADPLSRRRAPPSRHDDHLTSSPSPSPSWPGRGLDELLIREIPTVCYSTQHGRELVGSSKCVVCLNEFRDRDMLRVLPKCGHAFHLDCIDVWFLSSSSCPLCRSAISGRNRYRAQLERIVAPTSSPQGPHPPALEGMDDLLEIAISSQDEPGSRRFLGGPRSQSLRKLETAEGKTRKCRWVSVMGDEGIDLRGKDGDDDGGRYGAEPIRRSFSMDSAVGPHVYLSAQEILREIREMGRGANEGEDGSRCRRSIFRLGRESRSAVLPV